MWTSLNEEKRSSSTSEVVKCLHVIHQRSHRYVVPSADGANVISAIYQKERTPLHEARPAAARMSCIMFRVFGGFCLSHVQRPPLLLRADWIANSPPRRRRRRQHGRGLAIESSALGSRAHVSYDRRLVVIILISVNGVHSRLRQRTTRLRIVKRGSSVA